MPETGDEYHARVAKEAIQIAVDVVARENRLIRHKAGLYAVAMASDPRVSEFLGPLFYGDILEVVIDHIERAMKGQEPDYHMEDDHGTP